MDLNQDTEQSPDCPKPRKPSFRIRSLLLIVFVVAIVLGAYELGRKGGYSSGSRDGFDDGLAVGLDTKRITKVYKIADLVTHSKEEGIPTSPAAQTTFEQFNSLMKDIENDVVPVLWEANGGNATMAPYPQNLSLIVSANIYGHDQLVEYIEERRESMSDGKSLLK